MKDSKKKIAAVTAVVHYLKTQEESIASLQTHPLESSIPAKDDAAPPTSVNLWGLGGRQYQMQLRTMMQMKAFHGSHRI
jgi:hypothetical protein